MAQSYYLSVAPATHNSIIVEEGKYEELVHTNYATVISKHIQLHRFGGVEIRETRFKLTKHSIEMLET